VVDEITPIARHAFGLRDDLDPLHVMTGRGSHDLVKVELKPGR
jgi:hypothetical protein